MDAQQAVDLGREAMMVTLLISSPVLVVGLVVGLIIGLLQALTQIQEQTVAFVPKLIAMLLALSIALPWVVTHFLEYTQTMITEIPNRL